MGARIATKPLTKLTTKLVPPNLYTSDAYPHLGSGVEGKPIPYGLGRQTLIAQLIDTTIAQGKYQWGDPSLMSTAAVHGIVALARSKDGIERIPVPTQSSVIDQRQNSVIVSDVTLPPDTYMIEVDVTGKPDVTGTPITAFGPVVSQLLQDLLGLPPGQIDITGTVGETKPLGVWLGADGKQRTLDAVLNSTAALQPSVARSVNGRIQMNTDGTWVVRKFDPTRLSGVQLARSELVRFEAVPDESAIFWKVIAYYNQNLSTGNFPYQQATSVATRNQYDASDALQVYTYLRLATDAALVAAQLLAVAGGPRVVYEIEERTNKLFQARSGDIIEITTTPAQHPSGTFTAEDFWIESRQLTLTPSPKTVARVRRVTTAVQVDPVAIIPLLHWNGPTGVGVQDMRGDPFLPFTTPGVYTLTVDANMTLLFRGVAGGAGGGGGSWVLGNPGNAASGGSGGAANLVGDLVVLQQGSTYTLTVGANGLGGFAVVGDAGQDGSDGGDTFIGVQGGTRYIDLQGGRQGKHPAAGGIQQIAQAGGAARAGANSRSGGNGGAAPPGNPINGSGTGVPGGGGAGAGGNSYPTPGNTGGSGGNGGQAGQSGTVDDTLGESYGGHGGDGAGVSVPGITGIFGAGGGGGGNVSGFAASSSADGRPGQKGVATLTFVSVP